MSVDGVSCRCDGFIGATDVAKPIRKAPSNAERLYREAYEAGIREASPQPFTVAGQRIGSVLGPVLAAHAKGLHGADLLAWIREKAREFRKVTDDAPQFWGGWQPFNFARWLNMGQRSEGPGTVKARGQLQPAPSGGIVTKSVRLSEIKS